MCNCLDRYDNVRVQKTNQHLLSNQNEALESAVVKEMYKMCSSCKSKACVSGSEWRVRVSGAVVEQAQWPRSWRDFSRCPDYRRVDLIIKCDPARHEVVYIACYTAMLAGAV